MSDNEEFLARWSRRKHEAKHAGEAEPRLAEPMEAQPQVPSDGSVAEPANPEIDLSSLPPVNSIDAATDITAFLRKGIPQELSRAALRRAWSADPAIRDFVGLAENAWDFNDPDAMPGFGPLDPSQVELGALAGRTVEGIRQVVAEVSDTPAAAGEAGQAADRQSNPGKDSVSMLAIADAHTPDASMTADVRPVSTAPQPLAGEKVEREEIPARRRTHGGALPH
jgi:hypothetical protein